MYNWAMKTYKRRSNIKIVTDTELANYYRLHRHTIARRTKEFGLDYCDWRSLLAFNDWMNEENRY